MKRKPFSIIELMVVIAIILILIALVGPIYREIRKRANVTSTINNMKNIVLIMQSYANDDPRKNKMPYPLPKGSEKLWGEDATCWSPAVAKFLFERNKLKRGDESTLLSAGRTGEQYEPMTLPDDSVKISASLDPRWELSTPLDFHLYCHKNLTASANGRTVIAVTYDNDDIRYCQFNGEGWVVSFMSGENQFFNRKLLVEYDVDGGTVTSVDSISATGETNAKAINSAASLRKNLSPSQAWGKGGGSTELVGIRDNDAIYKAFVE